MTRRPIALTCGDPAGIGPEIAVAAWAELRETVPFFWIGDPAHLPEGSPVIEIDDPSQAQAASREAMPVLTHRFPAAATPGRPTPANAHCVISAIERGVGLVMGGQAAALTTGPINKKALIDGADFPYPGHTEYLAALAGVDRVVMMLACPDLHVVPTTIHIPLDQVPAALTPDLLEDTIRLTHAGLIDHFGVAKPRLAVAGLNPHAGEGGAMGHEDLSVIAPVVARLAAEGLDVTGPYPADTMFHAKARAGYDAAIAMYHDQALIPIKTIDFEGGVNVTLGLPFLRTSPDHGTAYDIAGKGIADATSLIAALRMAADPSA
ncbi:MAG: 4-hydroxythreonine-4-phosphate dehydrogenase PdxA [Pseudomonadota bacterium]